MLGKGNALQWGNTQGCSVRGTQNDLQVVGSFEVSLWRIWETRHGFGVESLRKWGNFMMAYLKLGKMR